MEPTYGWDLWRLRVGDLIVVTPGGPQKLVTRVTIGAAYFESYDALKDASVELAVDDKKERRTEYISANSYVNLLERGLYVAEKKDFSQPSSTPRPELPPIEYKKTKGKRT
jgi:hypothetical protein